MLILILLKMMDTPKPLDLKRVLGKKKLVIGKVCM